MSSQKSHTPSTDSDPSTNPADLAASDADNITKKFMDKLVFERKIAMLDSRKPAYHQEGPEKELDEWRPVDYRGTKTRPLAYFGKCEVKPETEKLPWISDNTSGKVHPDMPKISMLSNEDLTLPKVAENFVKQSPALQEEARWERLKAAFYSFYPQDLKEQVFQALNGMLSRKASQIVAMKTLRFENEIVFIPKPKSTEIDEESDSENQSDMHVAADSCTKEDAIKVNKQLPKISREHRKQTASALKSYKSLNKKLSTYSSFSGEEIKYSSEVPKKSELWIKEVEKYKEATRKCNGARFISYHLDHAVARHDPRTGWIHMKTQLLRPGLKENKSLPKGIFDFKIDSKFKIKGSTETQNAAVDKQMELFDQELRTLSTGHLSTLESYHNDMLYQEFEVRISFDRIKPSFCQAIVKELVWGDVHIASEPQVHRTQKLHHVLRVYINIAGAKAKSSDIFTHRTYDATAESINRYGCCLNCFSKEHMRHRCEEPVYDFAHPVKAKDQN